MPKIAYLVLVFLLAACGGDDYIPKPRSYYRIQFPEKSYTTLKADCPYKFEYPAYTEIVPDMRGDEKYCWMNIHYPQLKANVHISYKPIVKETDFQNLLSDAYTFVEKHNLKAERITEERITNNNNAHGLLFRIGGNTASNLQFFLTDSTDHFLRASLYFNTEPNKDSLAPVVKFVEKDINHLIETFEWTDVELETYR